MFICTVKGECSYLGKNVQPTWGSKEVRVPPIDFYNPIETNNNNLFIIKAMVY